MKALVTGASGFIGKELVKTLLERGDQVITASRSPLELDRVQHIIVDMKDPKTLMDLEVDVIYHLAANPSVWWAQQNPVEDFMTNAGGTLHMLELAKKCGARLVLPSSIALYGGEQDTFKEEDIDLRSFYALSKYTAEQYCKQYFFSFDVNSVVLRLGYVYGPGVSRGPISDIKKGGPLFMNAESELDFVHVKDVVSAMLYFVDKGLFGIYNIGSGEGTKVQTLIQKINKDVKPNQDKPVKRMVLDISKAKAAGWQPKITMEEGLCNI